MNNRNNEKKTKLVITLKRTSELEDPGSAEQGPAASIKSFKGPIQVDGLSVEDTKNFPDTQVTPVIRLGQGSKGIMNMLDKGSERPSA